jgi:2-iminobutanoate/2-iminopropanoate deaminase
MQDIVNTDKAPKAIGPYSQAVKANGFIFVSGQIPIDPDTSAIVKEDIAEQTIRVIKNIKNILESAGSGLEYVVKTTVYLRDLKKFDDMNRVYGGFFTNLFPARATVEVSNLPKGVDIEIDAIAIDRAAQRA